MRSQHKNQSRGWIGILGACLLVMVSYSWARNPELAQIREDLGQYREKISPVLLDEVAFTKVHPAYDREIPVIVKVNKEYFEEDLENRRRLGRSNHNMLRGIHGYSGRLTTRQIEALLESDQVEYVTLDAKIRPTKRPTERTSSVDEPTTDEPLAEAPSSPEESAPIPSLPEELTSQELLATIGVDQIKIRGKSPDGGGIGLAVFDSGLTHLDLRYDGGGVTKAVDFTSGSPVVIYQNQDRFGHGSAVAGVIGGDGEASAGEVLGIAPQVDLIDLKVVGPDGTGYTSHLIQAIDWLIENRPGNVRVANLSLGHPPIESYKNDPLCQAVERMVEAGIVTVVSAGNLGKTAEHPEIWGGISSPGNDPLVITVGAMNTHGTVTHSDDTATTYSSRGPTYIDNLFKPDLVAPGNAILAPSAPDSYLAETFPQLVNGDYIRLSGSSLAAAVVSGTVALMLDANEGLNPNLVKLILLSTAIKMQEPSMLEQGNGMLNAKTAVELSKAVDAYNQNVEDIVSPTWTLEGEYGPEEVWAGGAIAYGDQIVYGDMVQADMAGFWGEGVFWTDFLFSQEGVFWADSLFQKNGVFWTDGTFWLDALAWTEGVFWTDVPFSFDGVFWTDFFTEGVFWTDCFVIGDGTETDINSFAGD